jgi:hypothetical protein
MAYERRRCNLIHRFNGEGREKNKGIKLKRKGRNGVED